MLGITMLCLMFGALAHSQGEFVIYSWGTSLSEEGDTVLVFLQNGSSWYNQVIAKRGPSPANMLVKRFKGKVDVEEILKGIFGEYEVHYDETTGETTITFFDPPDLIRKGDVVRVCVKLKQDDAQLLKEYWILEDGGQVSLPTPGWRFRGQDLIVLNQGLAPVEIWNFRRAYVDTPVSLEYLSEEGLSSLGIVLRPIDPSSQILGPGLEFLVQSPEAPAFTQWGLIALGVLLSAVLVVLIARRYSIRGSQA